MGPFQLSVFQDSSIIKLNHSWAVCTKVVCTKHSLLRCVCILPAQKIKEMEPWLTRKWSSGWEVNEMNGSICIRQTVTAWLNLLFIISINVKHDAHAWKTKEFCGCYTLHNTKQCLQDIDFLLLIKTHIPLSFRQQKEPGGLGDCSNVVNISATLEHQIPKMPD